MKSLFVALCIGTLMLVGCDPAEIVGSGTIVTQDRQASAFNGLDTRSAVDVVVTKGTGHSIRVEADDNIIGRIKTSIVNGILHVDVTGGTGLSFSKATVYVTTDEIRTLMASGSGRVTLGPGFDMESLIIYMYGSGNVSLQDITLNRLTTNLLGAGSLSLSGNVKNHSAALKGSGWLEAYDANTAESAVVVYGAGSAHVHASNVLFADIFGAGDIVFKGDPELHAREDGSGRVKRWK